MKIKSWWGTLKNSIGFGNIYKAEAEAEEEQEYITINNTDNTNHIKIYRDGDL